MLKAFKLHGIFKKFGESPELLPTLTKTISYLIGASLELRVGPGGEVS